MNEEERERYVEFYTERLEEHGATPRALGWRKERQPIRYRIQSGIGDVDGKRVLDVGCGFGDYYGYLREQGYDIDYYGLDLHPEFVDIARNRYPDATFDVLNVLESDPPVCPDYVFGCGIFNFELEDMDEYVEEMVERMFSLAKEGIAVDFMTSYIDYENENSYHVDPGQMFGFGKSLTDRVALRHDYMPYEFTMYLYVADSISGRNVFTAHEVDR